MMTKIKKINQANLGEIPGLSNSISAENGLEIFEKMCFTKYFEENVIKVYNQGLIKIPIYLSIGQESISAAISVFFKPDLIFAQHRAHSVYLAFGGDPVKLIDELMGKDSGCSQGKGGGSCIQDDKIGMIAHHGLIGEQVPLAVGAALGNKKKKVVCFLGDGASEEDYVFTAIAFALTHKLPVLFICEDNNLAVLTKKSERRSWELADALRGIGLPSVDITDNPWLVSYYVKKFKGNLPAFINCRTCRCRWHRGSGTDGKPKWDRFELTKQQLSARGLNKKIEKIENKTKKFVDNLWENRLRKQ